ncbi:transmembrane protein, putative (macronuclear) [Tetrahymena thermophila SB210]|uniref:Transmembrane protein, putative n=1 Tax=Tetrahymena thermophila (strain SB210) TaxID=312017 RepID=Q22NJ8_TETTS|nr:transmembrane protein, putative [Tetrahymena thermophila SB210]EAR86787.1 transmembrane protein, putative [Tetrahymena thermophila SB210]|eukprot:XP_001007032.1 transmembrane protein, putative [Tetrahymena thermophila SB210]
MKVIILIAIIAFNAVKCDTPSWASSSVTQTAKNCVTALVLPTCLATTCADAAKAYSTCIICSSNNGSFSAYLSCAKSCANTYINDPTTKGDTTVATYANGYTSCIQAMNGSLLALSGFFITILALLF